MRKTTLFKSKFTDISYNLLQTENGVKVIHLVNPHSRDTYISTIHKAGAIYDTLDNTPEGTSHMLEHILICNPNKNLKNRKAINKFEIGNKEHPYLSSNGHTSAKYMYLNVDTHHTGATRAFQRLNHAINQPYPFDKFLEKEKSIVLAERSRKVKREQDGFQKSLEFLFGEKTPEFTTNILGEDQSIKDITPSHLEKLYQRLRNTNTSVITIQSPQDLSQNEIEELNLLTQNWSQNKPIPHQQKKYVNEFKVGAFQDPRETGINLSFAYFADTTKNINYKKEFLDKALRSILWQLSFEKLREELGLIYDMSAFVNNNYCYNQKLQGLRLTCSFEKLEQTLNELHTLLHEGLEEYLESQEGIEEFYSYLSTYIFHKTTPYNKYLGETVGAELIEDEEIFNINKMLEITKELEVKDLQEHLKNSFVFELPHIWISSDQKEKVLKDIIFKSPFNKM